MVRFTPMPVDTVLTGDPDKTIPETPLALAEMAAVGIPKLGHLVWVGPHRPPQEMMDTWVVKNPTMIWSIWGDHTATAGWENQKQINDRASRKEWNGVADIIRYELLWRYGGICVDADSECIKPLVEGDFFEQTTAVACYEHEGVRPGIIGCGFLGAAKAHPFFRACIDECALTEAGTQAWKAVGPQLMGRVALRMPSLLRVYPARMFNPTHYTGVLAPGDAPIFANQGWGSTKGYNALRKLACTCPDCSINMLRCPWG